MPPSPTDAAAPVSAAPLSPHAPVLVLGATGKTGRRVAERLTRRGIPVRAGSRSGDRPFDWNRPEGWPAVLDGVSAVYITYQPDLAVPGAPEAVRALVGQALAQGVRRFVLLSGRGEAEAQRAEAVLQAADCDWTIVRASWFTQNFSESFLIDPVRAGHVTLPVGTAREPFIDADDIADVVAAALSEPGHEGQLYEVTGPALLSYEEMMEALSATIGRPVRFERISAARYRADLTAAGLPEEMIDLLLYLMTEVTDGRNESLGDGVQRALGRPPRPVSETLAAIAATGLWERAA
ncbi:NAD(P)H-binding protein [Marivibrio halodurans]|uniref:NAD(P)H-binding protein n=1 Tax=Marivibrio halodurans TaxID=2039722 RepID=A0A8J7S107_9PROT|nr:NAD(P)H-binding protein [Marivibrio halodurans]MBP5857920.1 NAD(P)H-binding protein [Marivibrio halodurans]